MQQPELMENTVYLNTGLFADYFLSEKLPASDAWREAMNSTATEDVLEKLKELYQSKKGILEHLNEAQTEQEFIQPVLAILGFSYIVQTPAKAMGRSLKPDYALLADNETKNKAYEEVDRNNYSSVLAIADAKFWNRTLDKKIQDARDTLTNQNPSFQISSYMLGTKAEWAILTNGRLWRLYSREHSQTRAEYFQVDLQEILESGDIAEFLYFYLFFRKKAFLVVEDRVFLDRVVRESIDYGHRLQGSLKSLIFEGVFEHLAQGFLAWRRHATPDSESPDTGRDIFANTLILLYRLLFLLYAESRDLLPVKEAKRYYTKSLAKIKGAIKNDFDNNVIHSSISTDYWDDLLNLFHIIDSGDPALNIPKYNGGLFSRHQHGFLEDNKIADSYLARAIFALTTYTDPEMGGRVFVDFKSLGVKQLGSIYEGLLEFRLSQAEEELAIVRDRGKERYVAISDLKSGMRCTNRRIQVGELYLENDRAERKATGSYYTPDYVVEHLIGNTVGPLIDRLEQTFAGKVQELRSGGRFRSRPASWKNRELARYDPAIEALKLKICDPAMGSGHFLVSTVDYIANRIFGLLGEHSDQIYFGKETYESPLFGQIQEIREHILAEIGRQGVTIDRDKLEDDKVIIRRMVMKRCIFGVDVNYLAVELAKLSLWLDSFTVGAPLSFLDHHIRRGNSLIGAGLAEAQEEIKDILFGSTFSGLISATDAMIKVGELTDSTFAELEESHRDYDLASAWLAPYKAYLNLWTSHIMGNPRASDLIQHGTLDPDHLASSLEPLSGPERKSFERAQELAERIGFFHWELEFPEAYFEKTGRKADAGFDAIIGNPPYIRIQELNASSPEAVGYYRQRFGAATGSYDIYVLFTERGHALLSPHGLFGYIMPNKFPVLEFGRGLRKYLTDGRALGSIVDFGDNQVFPQQTTYTCLLFLTGEPAENFEYLRLPTLATEAIPAWLDGETPTRALVFETKDFSEEPWLLVAGDEMKLIEKLDSISMRLENLTEQIFQGLITSADDIYIVKSLGLARGKERVWSKASDEEFELEPELLKPLVSGEDVDRYSFLETDKRLIFPYRLTTHGAELIPAADFASRYPLTWQYLQSHEEALRQREHGRMDHDQWYAFGRTQNLDKHERPKLGSARLASRLSFAADLDGSFYFDNVDVNGILLKDESPDGAYLMALLNSRLLDWRFKKSSVPFRGSFYSANKQFIAPLPIRGITFSTDSEERRRKLEQSQETYLAGLDTGSGEELLTMVDGWMKKEQLDIVHDLLAWLANQMMEANSLLRKEADGFLRHMEREIGIAVEELSSRTTLTKYHYHSFEDILAVLTTPANRRRLRGFNPRSRGDVERLEQEFTASVDVLRPLKERIQATDRLIDAAVYRLYGLSEDEVRMVESS